MEEQPKSKQEVRDDITNIIGAFSSEKLAERTREIANRLFGFANFLEANIALLYANKNFEVPTHDILKKYLDQSMIEVIPLAFMRGRTLNNSFVCLLYTSPSPRDRQKSRMPSSA